MEYIPRLAGGMDILVNFSIFTLCTLPAYYGHFAFFLMIVQRRSKKNYSTGQGRIPEEGSGGRRKVIGSMISTVKFMHLNSYY